jgi:hypothetical protein
MPFTIDFDARDLERNLPRGTPQASVFNDKRTRSGRSIFKIIDKGRGPVRAIRARALRIPLRSGRVIFRKSAGPAPAQDLTERAVADMNNAGATAVRFELSHGGLVGLINMIARVGFNTLRQRTPRRGLGSGRALADSYRLDEAR